MNCIKKIAPLILVCLVLATPAFAEWTSGETSMSHLTPEEFAAYCNLSFEIPEGAKVEYYAESKTKDLPVRIDWRDYEGENYMTPIKDQHPCGTCATFSSLAAFESNIKIKTDNSFVMPDLSEEHVYACEGPVPYTLFHPMIYLKGSGAPDEACFPYDCESFSDRPPCSATCDGWDNRIFKTDDYKILMWPSNDALKEALQDGPIVVGFQVHPDFQTYTGGVFDPPDSKIIGGHGVALIGYDDEGEYWIAKNSWGPGWGEDGYFKYKYQDGLLKFGYQASDMTVTLETLCGDNLPPTISNLAFLNDTANLDEGDDLSFSFAYEDFEANLAGGELWYAIDNEEPARFETPVSELAGISSQGKEATFFTVHASFEAGEHTITIYVKDLCGASSDELTKTFTVGDVPADDDDDDDSADDDDTVEDDDDEAPVDSDDDDDDDDDDDGGCCG